MTNVHIVLLGLLCNSPMHGYELKQVIEEHMNDWTDIKFGSIYFALNKLSEKGDVEMVEETREGNRPDKRIYRITEQGKKTYLRLLKNLWAGNERTFYGFDIALFFIQSLPKEEVRAILENRIVRQEQSIAYLTLHEQQQTGRGVPPQASFIMRHSLVHLEAELAFLKELKDGLDALT